MIRLFFVMMVCLLGFTLGVSTFGFTGMLLPPSGFALIVPTFDFTGMLPPPTNPDPGYYTDVFGYGDFSDPNTANGVFCWVHDTSYRYLTWGYYNPIVYLAHTTLQQNYNLDKMTCFFQATPTYDHWIKGGDTTIPTDGVPGTYYYVTPQPGTVGDYFFSSFDLYATAPYARNFNSSYGLEVVQEGTFMMSANYNRLSTLTVSREPEAGGGVASLPDGTNVNCNATGSICCGVGGLNNCSGSFAYNYDILLKPFSSDGYTFDHWRINGVDYDDEILGMAMIEGVDATAVYNLSLKLPLTGGKSWELHVEVGGDTDCSIQGPDSYHTGSGYYALDFDDYSEEYGQEIDVPVLAAATGTVVPELTGEGGPFGWTVVLDHGNGYRTRYAHLKNEPTVSGTVEQGQQIGIIGTTGGASTGTHLHFQVYYNGSSASTIPELGTVKMENIGLSAYSVGCHAYYESTNAQ